MTTTPPVAPVVDVAGHHLLITGGGTGIGRAIALGAAGQGAEVIVVGRRAQELEDVAAEASALAGSVLSCPGDVTSADDVRRVLAFVDERWGRADGTVPVDGLVNAAGIARIVPAEAISDELFAHVMDINVTGSFRMCREIGRLMLANSRGSIVNIGSLTSAGGFPGRAAYAVSKHAVIGLTRTLASEWGASGIRVNAIVPGFIKTPMTDSAGERGLLDFPAIERRTPQRRRGLPPEMVGPVLFLLSDAASFVNGECMATDGGWLAYSGPLNDYDRPRNGVPLTS